MAKRIKINVSTGWANGDYNEEMELPDNWEELSEKEQDELLNEVALDLLHECCEVAAWVEEE